jgi:hypothetical protein
MVRTSFPEIGAEHMLQSLTAGCGRKRQLTGVGSKTAIAAKRTVGCAGRVTEKGSGLPPRRVANFKPRANEKSLDEEEPADEYVAQWSQCCSGICT